MRSPDLCTWMRTPSSFASTATSPKRSRASAGEVAKRSEGFADVLEAERRLRGRCGRPPRLIDGRRADAQPLAPGTSGEESQRRSDCAGRHGAEEIGELPHLFGA